MGNPSLNRGRVLARESGARMGGSMCNTEREQELCINSKLFFDGLETFTGNAVPNYTAVPRPSKPRTTPSEPL